MKISIVTISFNQANFLKECIDSVLTQANVEVEYIVVDPGSTDGSREIIRSYGENIIQVFSPDSGPADGLNKGFAKASGDVFGFINSDDYLLPGALEKIGYHFTKFGLDEFVSGPGFIEYDKNIRKQIHPTKMNLDAYLYGACTIFQQGTFFPAKGFRVVNGFNRENRTCWDGELFSDLLHAGYKHRVIDDDLAVFRIHPASISGSGRLEVAYRLDLKRIFRKMKGREYSIGDYFIGAFWRSRKILHRLAKAV